MMYQHYDTYDVDNQRSMYQYDDTLFVLLCTIYMTH